MPDTRLPVTRFELNLEGMPPPFLFASLAREGRIRYQTMPHLTATGMRLRLRAPAGDYDLTLRAPQAEAHQVWSRRIAADGGTYTLTLPELR